MNIKTYCCLINAAKVLARRLHQVGIKDVEDLEKHATEYLADNNINTITERAKKDVKAIVSSSILELQIDASVTRFAQKVLNT